MVKDELEIINQDFKNALLFEDKFSRFNALNNVAKETSSSDIPNFLKARILNSINEQQQSIIGLMDIEHKDLSPCFIV